MQPQIIAASKTQSISAILDVLIKGINQFGENRVQEAADKIAQLSPEQRKQTTWHMIGHLQSGKVKQAVEIFDWIQSVHTLKLAEQINEVAAQLKKTIPILVQVNISGEKSKSGFAMSKWQKDPAIYKAFAQELLLIKALPFVQLKGFMTIAPIVDEPEKTRPYFQSLKLLQEQLNKDFPQLNLTELSMGMTGDYPIAMEEGATMVRLGRMIFGEKKN